MSFEIVNPKALGQPKGFSHGVVAPAGGRILFVAGQVGWDEAAATAAGAAAPPDFATQFVRALDRVLEVVRGAGGAPSSVSRMTIYVTDLQGYRSSRSWLAEAWRARFGTYYPAMTLVEVRGLVDKDAVVEIEATAVLVGDPSHGD